MAIELKKGQTVDLTKKHAGLDKITIGLSWGSNVQQVSAETEPKQKKGFLARLFDKATGGTSPSNPPHSSIVDDMDIDSSVVMVDTRGSLYDKIYYGNRKSSCRSIVHAGDDLTGKNKQGNYDNEEIEINLKTIPSDVEKLVFLANIYNGEYYKQHFGQVGGAYIRVLQSSNREELIRYDLADEYDGMRGLVVGELYRYQGEWKFRAIGQATKNDSLSNLISKVAR